MTDADTQLPGAVQRLFGLEVNAMTIQQAVTACDDAVHSRSCLIIGVINAAKVVHQRDDRLLRHSLSDCDLLLADGQSVVWASRILRKPLPERVAGIDLFEALLEVASSHGHSVYLLGARPEVLEELQAQIRRKYPSLRIAGARDGYFTAEEEAAVVAHIRSAHCDMLFLGMSSPKKELFMDTYGRSLGVGLVHGVGGSFDVLSGHTRRAPPLLQRTGLEWIYRLAQEPGRLWRRYLYTNTMFAAMTLREWTRRRR